MLGTVGLEVTNSADSKLSWKTVTKGKRSRKSMARSLNGRVGLGSKSPKRVGDFSGSDSDKFGDTDIQQCNPDKGRHLPIKKRRHFFRSPSPSSRPSLYSGESVSPELQTTSSHSDDLEHLSDHNGSSGSYTNRRGSITMQVGNGFEDGVAGDKISEVSGGELYNSDNFSGIALLAAASDCINNNDDDTYNGKRDVMEISSEPQRSDASTCSLPVREGWPGSESGNSVAATHSSDENEEGMAVRSVSSKVDRRHWDLNTVMDAWEQPNDVTADQCNCLDASTNGILKFEKEKCATQTGKKNNGNDAENSLPLDQIENAIQSSASKVKENESEEFFCRDRSDIEETSLSNLEGDPMAPLNLSCADAHSSGHVLSSNKSMNDLALPETCHSSEIASTSGIVKLEKEECAMQRGSSTNGKDAVSSLPPDLIENAVESSASKMKENESKELFCHDRSNIRETSLQNIKAHPMAPLNLSSVDSHSSRHVLTSNVSIDNLALPETCHSSDVSGSNLDIKSSGVAMFQGEDTCTNVMVFSSLNISKQNVALSEVSASEKFGCQNDGQLKDAEDSQKISESPDTLTAIREDTYRTLDVEISESKDKFPSSYKSEGLSTLDISVVGQSTVFCDDKGQDEKVLTAHTTGTDAGVRSSSNEVVFKHEDSHDSDGQAKGRSILQDSGKGFILNDCHNSDVSQDDHGHMDGKDSMAEIQVGYDSPYEDGELRGSVLCFWEGNEIEDGEHECLDCDSLGGGNEYPDAGDCPGSEKIEASSQGPQGTEKKRLLTLQVQETDSKKIASVKDSLRGEVKENTKKIETVGKRVPNQGSGSMHPDVFVERNVGSTRRHDTSYHVDAVDVKGSYDAEVGSKITSRRKLQSRIEGPLSLERGTFDRQQSRCHNSGGKYLRVERDVSPDRFMTRYRSSVYERERNGGDSHLVYWDSRNSYPYSHRGPEGHEPSRQRSAVDNSVEKLGGANFHDQKQSLNHSSRAERDTTPERFVTRYRSAVHEHERIEGDSQPAWESRNHYASSYHGPEGHGPAKPRSANADSVDKFGGLDFHDHKQSISYSSKDMQRPVGWRRSPIDSGGYHGGQRTFGGFSSNRDGGGSRNFPEGVGRGLRKEHYQPVNDDTASSLHTPHYLSRRGRIFSSSNGGAHVSVSRRTSRSRSRTRSPRAWQPQRDRNLGARRHSRSPDFRSEARMGRTKVPYQKPIFADEFGESIMSPPRGRFSPQRNYRGVDRNFVDNHSSHRRSPLNVFRQSQRLDSIGLSGRLKSDDSFRPMRPGRFPPMAGVGRGCKFEDNSDDNRHDDRSGLMHQGWSSDSIGVLRDS